MSCSSCYKNTWQQKRSDYMPVSQLAQKAGEDAMRGTNSLLASTANFVARVSPAYVQPGRPWPYVTVVPYYNNLVSAVVPQGPRDAGTGALVPASMDNGGSAYTTTLASMGAPSGTVPAEHWHQTFNTDTYCGCCKHPYSPLPPQGAHLLQNALLQRQMPVQELMGPTCNKYYQKYY